MRWTPASSQVIRNEWRRGLRSRVAQQLGEQPRRALGEAWASTSRSAAVTAFYDLLAAQESLSIARENVADAERVFELTQRQFDVGRAPRQDVVKQGVELGEDAPGVCSRRRGPSDGARRLHRGPGEPDGASLAAVGTLEFRDVELDEAGR